MSQPRAKCAFLGPQGTYSHQAALELSKNKDFDLIPFATIGDLFKLEVQEGQLDGVVQEGQDGVDFVHFVVSPIENSTGGGVLQCLDSLYLMSSSASTTTPSSASTTTPSNTLFMKRQTQIKIQHCFLKRPDANCIKKIYSHPEAFVQCAEWLKVNMKGVALEPTSSTAQGALQASQDPESACISSQLCSELYGLEIVESPISKTNNTTRFILFERISSSSSLQLINPSTLLIPGTAKTQETWICADPKDQKLSLLLSKLSLHFQINRIFSRPAPSNTSQLWNYVYFIVLETTSTPQHDQQLAQVVSDLQKECHTLRILGSYPSEL